MNQSSSHGMAYEIVSTLNELFDQVKSLRSMIKNLDEMPQDLQHVRTNIIADHNEDR